MPLTCFRCKFWHIHSKTSVEAKIELIFLQKNINFFKKTKNQNREKMSLFQDILKQSPLITPQQFQNISPKLEVHSLQGNNAFFIYNKIL